ncbi:hypothetical protein ZIOFF_074512 (mitochondrion) [Zingiber officinale]|uniref:RNA-dependent RNA polymerase n=1 Tax=Zingiber officinale TaxID=94328 RepID=A0A8J5BUF5_ZINOF|nr:hypothetical protein ZIOFF_074505 [Zingiber officinale]KAG6467643.1 hypothetical protein ZIOFF_074512 [Zingiber officinale]
MSTKAKLTRCEVSKARLIYPFSKADVTDSSGFILIGYQKDKNYALTGRHLCLSSPILRPLAEREIEVPKEIKKRSQLHYKKIGCSLLPHSHPRILPIPLLSVLRCGPLPESKKKFGTHAVNGGGSGCSGDSFLVTLSDKAFRLRTGLPVLTISPSVVPRGNNASEADELEAVNISSFVPSVTRSMVLLVLLLALSYEFSTLLSAKNSTSRSNSSYDKADGGGALFRLKPEVNEIRSSERSSLSRGKSAVNVSLSRAGIPTIIPKHHRFIIMKRGDRGNRLVKIYLSWFSICRIFALAKRVSKATFDSIERPQQNVPQVEYLLGLIKEKFSHLQRIYLPRISEIPMFKGLSWKPTLQSVPNDDRSWAMRVLSRIPTDGTFNQEGPLHRLSSFKPLDVLSLDLSAATDRWPVAVLTALFTRLFGRATALCVVNGTLWWNVFRTHRPLLNKARYLAFSAGQPLGYYGSWALFSLSHHYMVWLAALLAYPRGKAPFRKYALLGDDIVIADRAVAEKYKALLEILDVSISESKSIDSKSGAVEFAKQFWVDRISINLTPVSAKAMLASSSLIGLCQLAEKYGLTRSCLIRLAGAGYRVRGRILSRNLSRRWKRLRVVADKCLSYYRLPLDLWLGGGNPLNPYLKGIIIEKGMDGFVGTVPPCLTAGGNGESGDNFSDSCRSADAQSVSQTDIQK